MTHDKDNQTQTGVEAPHYNADWSWFLRWMLITSVAAGAAPMVRAWLGDQRLPSLLIVGVGAAITYGAQAYELPHPLRREWFRWLAYGVVGAMVGSYFSGPVISFVFDVLDPFGRSSLTFALIAIPSTIPIILHWTTLRFYDPQARVWVYVMFAGLLVTTWLVSAFPTWGIVGGEMLPIVRNILWGLGLNVAAGGTLWWLFHHERTSE
jgi:hypothetical protein